MQSVLELEKYLSEPSADLIEDMALLEGDILILGAGGKMGPSLAKLARNAIERAGVQKDVIAVSRFTNESIRRDLDTSGVTTLTLDLLNPKELSKLPKTKNIIFMAGHKFGTTERAYQTWAMNTYLPGLVAEAFAEARIVAFSTGNVYPLTDVGQGGCTEEHEVNPVGEYAASCLGRERIFEYFSRKQNTPMLFFRLNYAIDLRYGILLEVAKAVLEERPIDVLMGQVNVIWQGDANTMALRALRLCSSPPRVLNVTGPETIPIRWLAHEFGVMLNRDPKLVGEEDKTALLSNATRAHQEFGYPRTSLRQMMDWTVEWLRNKGPVLDKPTHFQEREGRF